MLCKKKALPKDRKGPFLLDPKHSDPVHELSKQGLEYSKKIDNIKFILRYAAYIDAEIKVKISIDLFKLLADAGFFSNWTHEAPYKYFNGMKEGYIVLFRVFQIKDEIYDNLLERGRSGRNFYFRLSSPAYVDLITPVISDNDYYRMKQEIYLILRNNGWILEVNDYNTSQIERKISLEELLIEEKKAAFENSTLSLGNLMAKISAKDIKKKLITVETRQYYRDPDVSSFAQKRAGGVCECCGKVAPFIREDGIPYLETHHLIPLSLGGTDSISNICAVCPNCHRELHYGSVKSTLKEKIIKNLS